MNGLYGRQFKGEGAGLEEMCSRLFSIQGASHTSSVEGRIVTELPELPSSTTVSTVQWSCNQHLRVCSSQMGKYSLDTVY